MVFGWLFGDRKREEPRAEVAELHERALAATMTRTLPRAIALCRELCQLEPQFADGWNLLGINLLRRDAADPAVRCEAVLAWMRVLALKPADSRAADHVQIELQYPDELLSLLVQGLGRTAPQGDDAASALRQIGARARPAIEAWAASSHPGAERAAQLLARIG